MGAEKGWGLKARGAKPQGTAQAQHINKWLAECSGDQRPLHLQWHVAPLLNL